MLVLEGLVGLHRTIQLQLLCCYWLGNRLELLCSEWFAWETNREHSVILYIVPEHDFPGGSDGKVSVYSAGDLGSSPGLGRWPGEGNGNPLQYNCLEPGRPQAMGLQRVRHD